MSLVGCWAAIAIGCFVDSGWMMKRRFVCLTLHIHLTRKHLAMLNFHVMASSHHLSLYTCTCACSPSPPSTTESHHRRRICSILPSSTSIMFPEKNTCIPFRYPFYFLVANADPVAPPNDGDERRPKRPQIEVSNPMAYRDSTPEGSRPLTLAPAPSATGSGMSGDLLYLFYLY